MDCDECVELPAAMAGYLPLNQPGEALLIYEGEFRTSYKGRAISTDGRVTLEWRNERARLAWSVDPDADTYMAWRYTPDRGPGRVSVDLTDHTQAEIDVRLGGNGRGWIPGGIVGDELAPLGHVIAHWINLPMIFPSEGLHEHSPHGQISWSGRWRTSFGGWEVTFDARPDHGSVYDQAKDDESFVITHTMDLRRTDGSTFTGVEAEDVLAGLQYALSFAVGHWVCPAGPVGYSPSGELCWSEWAPLHAGSPRRGAGWWINTRSQDLAILIEAYFAHWTDPARREPLRFATTSAILAVETGYVEQRIQTAYSALEMLSWVTDILEGGMDQHKWRRQDADKRLRRLLLAASVDIYAAIRGKHNRALADFAKAEGLGDGPAAVTEVRHTLTHPKEPTALYQTKGLVADAARLACSYLELTILYRIGYSGFIADRTKPGRWVGEGHRAPWAIEVPPSREDR